jgi:hypothetical protein
MPIFPPRAGLGRHEDAASVGVFALPTSAFPKRNDISDQAGATVRTANCPHRLTISPAPSKKDLQNDPLICKNKT